MSVVLENYYDPNYNPSQTEIDEYGKWLGLELPEDNDLLWIAKDGLKAPLPENWKACKSEKGELYYFNFKSGQSIWDHPMDEHFKQVAKDEREKKHQKQTNVEEEKAAVKKEVSAPVVAAAEKKVKKKAEKKAHRKADDDVVSSDTNDDTAATEENMQAVKGGHKLAQLKNLKGAKTKPNSTVTVVEKPVQEAKPHNPEGLTPSSKIPLAPVFKTPGPEQSTNLHPFDKSSAKKEAPKSSPSPVAHEDSSGGNIVKEFEMHQQMKEEEGKKFLKEKEQLIKQHSAMLTKVKEDLTTQHNQKMEAFREDLETAFGSEKKQLVDQHNKRIEDLHKKEDNNLTEKTKEMEEMYAAKLREQQSELERHQEEEHQKVKQDLKNTAWNLSKDFSDELSNLQSGFVQVLQSIKSTASGHAVQRELARISEESEAFLQKEKQQSAEAVAKYKKDITEKFEALQEAEKLKLETIKREHQGVQQQQEVALAKIKRQHQEEVDYLNRAHEERLAQLRVEMEGTYQKQKAVIACELEEKLPENVESIPCGHNSEDLEESEVNELVEKIATLEMQKGDGASGPQSRNETPVPSHHVPRRPAICKTSSSTDESALRQIVASVLGEMLTAQGIPTNTTPTVKAPTPMYRPVLSDVSNRGAVEAKMPSVSPESVEEDNVHLCSKIPSSFSEQRALIQAEQQRLQEAKMFVERHRENVQERRMALKVSRSKWKKDVLSAKAQGVSSRSSQASMLRQTQASLDEQARGVDQDEAILRESEQWLRNKDLRLQQLQRDLECKSGEMVDTSMVSIDTQVLMRPFQITEDRTSRYMRCSNTDKDENLDPKYMLKERTKSFSNTSSRSTSPILTHALERIESRLQEVTSLIKVSGSTNSTSRSKSSSTRERPSTSLAANNVNIPTSSGSSKRRSSSAGKRVNFASLYPLSSTYPISTQDWAVPGF